MLAIADMRLWSMRPVERENMTTGIFLHHGMCFDFRVIGCNDESFGIRAIDVMIDFQDFRGLLFPIAPDLSSPTKKPGTNKRKCSWSQTENKAHATRRKTPIQI